LNLSELLDFFDPPITIGWDVAPTSALEHLQAKGLKLGFSYADIAAAEHASAFTVAKMMDTDLLADVKASLEDALASGKPFREWADEIIPTLQAKGWWGRQAVIDPLTGKTVVAQLGSPSRLATIFRTNMQSAYAVGEWDQIQQQAEFAPFLMYDAVDDHRTRPEHAEWDGKVFPVDHAFWKDHHPPNGWNCRCSVIQLSQDELEELGLSVSATAPTGTYAWTNPRTGKVEQIPVGIDPGFNHNPGQARLEQLAKLAAEKAKALPPDAAKAALAGLQATQAAMDQATAAVARQVIEQAAKRGGELAAASKAAERSAANQIQKALGEKTPYLAKAIQQVQGTKAGQAMTSTELLAVAKEKAAKLQASAYLSEYKKALLAGKTPNAKAQAAFDALPDEAQGAITAQIDAQVAEAKLQAAAAAELAELTANPNSLAGKALAKIDQEELTLVQVLDQVKATVAAAKAKQVAAQGLAGYQKAVLAGKTPTAAQKAAFDGVSPEQQAAVLKAVDEAKAAELANSQPTTSPAVIGTSPQTAATAFNADDLVQIGPQKGSNPGGLYQDTTTGTQWYIKRPADPEQARNEVLAAKLYELAGIEVPDLRLTTQGGKPAIASKIIDGLAKGSPAQLAKAADGFAVDAWLANWDVVGAGHDNLLLRAGVPVRVDTGGALRFRAQGGLKGSAFGPKVAELDSLRDAKKNPQAAAVFGGVSPAQLEASVARVLAIDDADIRRLVDEYGPLDAIERQKLADTLLARKADLAARFPNASQVSAKAKAQAIEAAEFAAREGLAEVNGQILTAIKGIATRAAKGAPLEAKDVQRATDARKALEAWLTEHGPVLTADAVRDARAYYAAWLDDLDAAVAGGAGSPAKWTGGKFDGYSARLRVDPARVKVTLPSAGVTFSQVEAKAVITKVLGPSAAAINIPKGTGAAAFNAVPLEHQRAIVLYTGSHYRALNEALRDGSASPPQRRYADLLNEALALAPKYQGRVTRGMSLSGDRLQRYLDRARASLLSGEPYTREAFSSTSKGDRAAFGGNVVEHIESRAGVHVKAISLHPGENEVLLKAGIRLQVTKVEEISGTWHVYMEEVDG
jgi:SPP1 gp7 family putative phage head morphogenesis protein